MTAKDAPLWLGGCYVPRVDRRETQTLADTKINQRFVSSSSLTNDPSHTHFGSADGVSLISSSISWGGHPRKKNSKTECSILQFIVVSKNSDQQLLGFLFLFCLNSVYFCKHFVRFVVRVFCANILLSLSHRCSLLSNLWLSHINPTKHTVNKTQINKNNQPYASIIFWC